jgi:hypothetical protein
LNELRNQNYSMAEAVDYTGDLTTTEIQDYIDQTLESAQKREILFHEAKSPSDLLALDEFLNSEFPGRWLREFQFWRTDSQPRRAFWMILKSNLGQAIGFARCAVRNRSGSSDQHWTPGSLRLPMISAHEGGFEASDGCLGPIGIAKSERGQGTGKILLGLTLNSLIYNKAKRVCIDWTNAFYYYQPLGLQISRRYETAWKEGL